LAKFALSSKKGCNTRRSPYTFPRSSVGMHTSDKTQDQIFVPTLEQVDEQLIRKKLKGVHY
ncbi:MAG: hypothetical protein AB2761_21175, partial [Candidatus Thiodiazotropha endolucinida]